MKKILSVTSLISLALVGSFLTVQAVPFPGDTQSFAVTNDSGNRGGTVTGDSGDRGGTVTGDSGSRGTIINIPNPLKANSIQELLDRIINFLIILGGPVLTLMVLVGAYYYLFSGADPDNVQKGKDTIKWAIIGFVLLLISKSVSLLLVDILGTK